MVLAGNKETKSVVCHDPHPEREDLSKSQNRPILVRRVRQRYASVLRQRYASGMPAYTPAQVAKTRQLQGTLICFFPKRPLERLWDGRG